MQNGKASSLRLDEMSWIDVAAHLARDPRLIMPIGALEQHGPHLPLGANTRISERIAHDLSNEFRVLCAPTMHYGLNYYGVKVQLGRAYAGTATLRQKTLHRAINELLATWESHGIDEFILITAHRHEPHLDALATLATRNARVRVLSIWDVDVFDLLEAQPGPQHSGEAETSLMLYLYPELVRLDRAQDVPLTQEQLRRYDPFALPPPPPLGPGVVGYPTAGTRAKGEAIYNRILNAIRKSVFAPHPAQDSESDTLQSA